MKKCRVLLGLLSFSLVVTLLTGCDKSKDNRDDLNDNKKTVQKSKTKVKTKCDFYKCIDEIKPENTVEEVNEIIGIEGVLTDEEHNFYEYDFGDDKKITLKFYSSNDSTIVVDYDKKDLKNNKVTLENLSDLKARINNGISYEEFKKDVGGVDGTLIEKSNLSNKYVWVTKNEGYVTASFSNSGSRKGMCTFFSGFGR